MSLVIRGGDVCDPNATPATVKTNNIPAGHNFFATNGANTSDSAVLFCCAPSAVYLVDACFLWCDIPEKYIKSGQDSNKWGAEFGKCLNDSGKQGNYAVATNYHSGACQRHTKGIGLTALFLAMVVCTSMI
jgi:hypothetical protein